MVIIEAPGFKRGAGICKNKPVFILADTNKPICCRRFSLRLSRNLDNAANRKQEGNGKERLHARAWVRCALFVERILSKWMPPQVSALRGLTNPHSARK